MRELGLLHGDLQLPDFLPDATKGVVRSVDSLDLEKSGVQALVMNTFHLMQNPGTTSIQALGGLHKMSGWSHPIVTDSGGFQIYSLIRQNPKLGSITNKGASFRLESSSRKIILTPEKSIQLQFSFGSDIVICLDDCTHVDDTFSEQAASIKRTVSWAKRCWMEFDRLKESKDIPDNCRPLLFAVVQGGGSTELRKQCADNLLEIGFDGYGYGGWPMDKQGQLLIDMLGYTREIIPDYLPLHALGIAHPINVWKCANLGYDLFDGALPTRDARHGRLYTFTADPTDIIKTDAPEWFSYIYVLDKRYIKDTSPISQSCDCMVCQQYSLGYLHHLFKIGDNLASRLATIHNLRFMTQLTALLRRGDA